MPIGPLMIDVAETCLSDEDCELLQHPLVGGVILFDRNIDTPEQVSELTAAIRDINPDLLIAVDQEGGRVQRLKQGFSRIPPMRQFGKMYDQDVQLARNMAETCGWLMAVEVLSVGIDFSFAPVLDIDHENSVVIGDRSFHREASKIVDLAHCFMHGMHKAGMQATGKHFPGHGFVAEDSHVEIPYDNRSYEEVEREDMRPFMELAEVGLSAVMPAHVVYSNIDPNPVCFSKFWIQDILRKKLKFDGVVFSDDLKMQGATVVGDIVQRVKLSLDAGCDMVLVLNHRGAILEILEKLPASYAHASSRLVKMRGVCKFQRDVLLDNPNWQHARELIVDFDKELM